MATIVKIQRSIMTTEGAEQVLIYNQNRSINYEGELPNDVRKAMGNSFKVFAKARYNKNTTKLEIKRLLPDQGW